MLRLSAVITLFLLSTIFCSVNAKEWKADEYNESEYIAAMAIMSKHNSDVDSVQLQRYSHIADSVMSKGITARNYAVQIVALTMKEHIAIASGKFDEVMRIEQQRMEIARTRMRRCISRLSIATASAWSIPSQAMPSSLPSRWWRRLTTSGAP